MERRVIENARRVVEFSQQHDYLQKAFFHLFGERLLRDGYVDAGYLLETTVKGTYYSQLKGSSLQRLYAKGCMPSENLDTMFNFMENMIEDDAELTPLEEEALIFWFFLPYLSSLKKGRKREYLLEILSRFLEKWSGLEEDGGDRLLPEIPGEDDGDWEEEEKYEGGGPLKVSRGIIYDSDLCSMELICSVEEFTREIFKLKSRNAGKMLFYRGHSRLDYLLLPGIKREKNWQKYENTMYQEILVRCAKDFSFCQTHLDYLVEMQHYGLPTRLLDITENPLVALYFACCSNLDRIGEVIVFPAQAKAVKYTKSDTVSVLAALPTLSYEEQKKLLRLCRNKKDETEDREYAKLTGKLAAEIKSRNPAFEPRIKKEDLQGHVFVTPMRNNQRIIKQDGSFIICGLGDKNSDSGALGDLRCEDEEGKRMIFAIGEKAEIMQELDTLSINQASLFPEIDDVAQYIKEKFR